MEVAALCPKKPGYWPLTPWNYSSGFSGDVEQVNVGTTRLCKGI